MEEPKTVILLSCSHDKRSGGEPLDRLPGSCRSFADCLPRQAKVELLGRRRQIFQLLKGQGARLYDADQKGGYRDERRCNRELTLGPDTGAENSCQGSYLHAYRRYGGRFFSQLEVDAPQFWMELRNYPVEVLFVSGLYGLVAWNDPVQEYDCHVRDHCSNQPARTVAGLWKPILTEVLCAYLERLREEKNTFRVLDMLSESAYQELFQWRELTRMRIPVFHRIFLNLAGADTLSKTAKILSAHLGDLCSPEFAFRPDDWYPVPNDLPELRFGFEESIGSNRQATREGDVDRTKEKLLADFRAIKEQFPEAFNALVMAEHSWRKVKDLERFDWGAIVVSFCRPVEACLRSLFPVQGEDKRTLGEMIRPLWADPALSRLCSELERLLIIRNPGVHDPIPLERRDTERARDLSLAILGRLPGRMSGHDKRRTVHH